MERILKTPPKIQPVSSDSKRPIWSVMIPTYNCCEHLKETLESVLAQDPGPEIMQIEVIDDCSSDGDVEALVKDIGKGRVGFYQQKQNVGHHRNFETCLNRSMGEYVHLLHGDDCVLNGYYKEIEKLFITYPEAGAAFVRNGYIDEWNNISMPEKSLLKSPGILENFLFQIAQGQMLQVVAMVVKRSVYEDLGGFYAVNYCEDWEMWIRIAAHYPVAYSPACLALYRGGQNNAESITSTAMVKGENFINMSKAINLTQRYLPADKRKYIKNMAKKRYSMHIAKASNNIYNYSSKVAFKQAICALKMHQNTRTIYWVMRLYLKHIRHFLAGKRRKMHQLEINALLG